MSRSTQKSRPEPISDINHVLTFGKYKGETVAEIVEVDPQYLWWLHNNSEFFELDSALLEEVECAINPNDAFSRREVERAVGRLSEESNKFNSEEIANVTKQ